MKSHEAPDQLDDLLIEYAVEHLEWPDSDEELDCFLADASVECDVHEGTETRVRHVLSVGMDQQPEAGGSHASHADEQGLLFLLDEAAPDVQVPPTPSPRSQSSTLAEIVRSAYMKVNEGYSIDKLVADPDRNARFIEACWKLGAQATQFDLNHLLLNARKNNLIGKVEGVESYRVPRDQMDRYLFASEFALRMLQDQEYFDNQRFVSLDRILCDPKLAQRFEGLARTILPGFSSLDYRWAALSIRKGQNRRATRTNLVAPAFEPLGNRDRVRGSRIQTAPGFFWLSCEQTDLYIGHAGNLREQVERVLDLHLDAMPNVADLFGIQGLRRAEFAIAPYPGVSPSDRESLKTQLVRSREPKLNVLHKGLRVA
jgi:site-specific DNA-methyltransferase (adenine-specific)